MRILATGDHHFDASSSRWPECLRIHNWIAEKVEAERPDAFLSAGDLYERASTPVERREAAAWLIRIAAVCPVVVVRGNHDEPLDLEILSRLKSTHPIIVEEGQAVHIVAGIAVACLGWPSRAYLRSVMPGATTPEAVNDGTRDKLADILRGFGAELAEHDGPRVLLSHAMVDGSKTSVGQPLIGCEANISLAELALAGADVTILGHVHKPQDWSIQQTLPGHQLAELPALYTGSPFGKTWGEVEEKSIVDVTFHPAPADYGREPRYVADWGRIPTPTTPMVLLEARHEAASESGPGGLVRLTQHIPQGAEVRLRFSVDADARDSARADADAWVAQLLEAGAVSVKVEEVVRAKVRARAPKMAEATTLGGQLDVLWDSRDPSPPATRRARLKTMAAQLEEEIHNAT